jgi:carbon-monoxide dehydrogenase medium subunit
MHAFDYRRPASLAEAVTLLAEREGALPLAGGMSLLSAMKLRLNQPECLVDLGRLSELQGIELQGRTITVGAMTKHAQVAASPDVRRAIPALAALAEEIGDRQVRNRGTIGGSLANNDPAACYPAAVLALGALVHTDRRRIAADDFFHSLFQTALAPGEVITSVEFPVPARAAYVKFHQPASRFALVGVFVTVPSSGDVRVAVTGAAPCVFRARALEEALSADCSPQAAAKVAIPADGLNSDMHGDAAYRAHLIPVLAARAVERLTASAAGDAR